MIGRITSLLRNKVSHKDDGGILFDSGATVPTDATAGYRTGCIFQHTDGGTGTAFYINEGSVTSCDFEAVAGLTAAQEALLSATAGTVSASKAVIVDASSNITGFGTIGCGAITATSLSTSLATAITFTVSGAVITDAAASVTIYGGNTNADSLILQGASTQATQKITIVGGTGTTVTGALSSTGALTAASIVCTAGATFGGGYGATGATISTAGVGQFNGALTTDGILTAAGVVTSAIVQINDNVALNFEGVASDIDGLQITCDNAGDALVSVTAGKLTLTTSDSDITTASVLTLTSTTAGIVINGAEAIGISILTSTPTDGINIAAACANAIVIAGANTVSGIDISGDCVTAIKIAAQTTSGITIASSGIGIEMNGTYNNCLRLTNALAASAQTTVRVLDTYSKVDGYHTSVMGAALYVPAGGTGTGAVIGVYGEANIQGTVTGAATWSFGVRGTLQLTNATVLNCASSIHGAMHCSMKDDATPTLTAGHVCGIYIDNLIDADLSAIAGITAMIYSANNSSATCTMDYGWYHYGPKVTNLLGLYDCTVSGCVSAGGTVGTHGTATLKIAIDIDGTTYYLLASTVPTFT